jgi:hypothetical protein
VAGSSPVASTNKIGSQMKCESCQAEGFLYERKIVDETFFLCEECDWSSEDIEIANKIGEQMIQVIGKIINYGNRKPN